MTFRHQDSTLVMFKSFSGLSEATSKTAGGVRLKIRRDAFEIRDVPSHVDNATERPNVRKNKVRTRNGPVQGDLATVDPGYRQSLRFAPDEIGELRLPGVQDFLPGAARMVDQVAKQRAVGLITPGPLGRAHQVEVLP